MNENTKKEKNPRRKFLKNIGLVGSGVILGGTAMYSGYRFEKDKDYSGSKIRLLTEEHRLVEVDKHAITGIAELTPADRTTRGRQGIKGRRWVMVI